MTGVKSRRDEVYVKIHENGRASWGNILRCGSVWACPVCAAKISLERTAELRDLLEEHIREGADRAGGWFVTLTIRHELRQRLKLLRQAVTGAWKQVRQLRRWREWTQELGYIGDVRALEVTVGGQAGWHPHLHVLMFFTRQPSEEDRAAFEQWLYDVWADRISALLGEPNRPHRWTRTENGEKKALGVSVEGVRNDPAALSKYLLKMGAALETAHWTRKKGRRGNRTMFEVLQQLHDAPHAIEIRLWREWTADMLGARQLTWSRRLRQHFELGAELTDEELVHLDDGAETIGAIDRDTFELYAPRLSFRVRVLEIAEESGAAGVEAFIARCVADWPNPRERPPPQWYIDETRGLG